MMGEMATRRLLLIFLMVVMAACSPGDEGAGTTQASTTSLAPATTTTTLVPTTSNPISTTTMISSEPVAEWVMQPALEEIPEGWMLSFAIPYGDEIEALGSAPGGDGLTLGPDYGAQAPDGTWWFLDAAKKRLAHYDDEGAYLDQVVLGEDLLVDGVYFQYQLPRVLADETVVASRFEVDATELLTLRDGLLGIVGVPAVVAIATDDGVSLYGFDSEGAGQVAIDPKTGAVTPTQWFSTQSGSRYRVAVDTGEITVELPDQGVVHVVPVTSSLGPGDVHVSVELATGSDGTIHLFALGISESDEQVQLAGYTSISPDGTLHRMEPGIDPFTPADPGSPSHLGVAYGRAAPWLMVVSEVGVLVYVRE